MKTLRQTACCLLLTLAIGCIPALAAPPDVKAWFEENILPIAQQADAIAFTEAEFQEIERMVIAEGIPWSNETRANLTRYEPYKDEVIRALLGAFWGGDPATWRISDQAWYDAQLVSIGIYPRQQLILPREGEIDEATALAVAETYANEFFPEAKDLNAPSRYLRRMQYVLSSLPVGPEWHLFYEPLVPDIVGYTFTIDPQGVVKEAHRGSPMREEPPLEPPVAKPLSDIDTWSDTVPNTLPTQWYSDQVPQAVWDALDAVGYSNETAATLMSTWMYEYGPDRMFWSLEAQAIDIYWHELPEVQALWPGVPLPAHVQREEAVAKATAAFEEAAQGYFNEELQARLVPTVSFYYHYASPVGDRTVWYISFVDPIFLGHVAPVMGLVVLDAATGEVLECLVDHLSQG